MRIMLQQFDLFEEPVKAPGHKTDTPFPTLPQYQYLILISPDQKTKDSVRILKEKLDQKIGLSIQNRVSVPHLSLFTFISREIRDDVITENLRAALAGQKGFFIALGKAGYFTHGSTADLILTIRNNDQCVALFK